MDKFPESKFTELEKEINRAAKEEKIEFIRFPTKISKIRSKLLLLSSIAIIGICFDIKIDSSVLGFEFNNLENQNTPIMTFFLISILYLLIYFIWNIHDYIEEYKIGNISKRGFGSFSGKDAKPQETLKEAVNSFIQYLKKFFSNENIPDAVKSNFEVSYKRMGIYAKGLSIFNKSQLLRFYLMEIGLPLFLGVIAIGMIACSII